MVEGCGEDCIWEKTCFRSVFRGKEGVSDKIDFWSNCWLEGGVLRIGFPQIYAINRYKDKLKRPLVIVKVGENSMWR